MIGAESKDPDDVCASPSCIREFSKRIP